jgi:phage baseplate assembly protein W
MITVVDIAHEWGTDLVIGPGGDLHTVGGDGQVRQRVLRRLLTNPGDYIWQINYGAGLAAFVGEAQPSGRVRAVVRDQLRLEPAVARSPEPRIQISVSEPNAISLDVTYIGTESGGPQSLSIKAGV